MDDWAPDPDPELSRQKKISEEKKISLRRKSGRLRIFFRLSIVWQQFGHALVLSTRDIKDSVYQLAFGSYIGNQNP